MKIGMGRGVEFSTHHIMFPGDSLPATGCALALSGA